MESFLVMLRNLWVDYLNIFDLVSFTVGSVTVSILDILLGLLGMGIIISVFWKGART